MAKGRPAPLPAEIEISIPHYLHDIDMITPDYYVKNYLSFLGRYISNGRPSMDTMNSYRSAIEQFLQWCHVAHIHPLRATENHIIYYRQWLYERNYKSVSIRAKLSAIQRFFFVASKLKLITDNPASEVKVPLDHSREMSATNYFTGEQLQLLFDHIVAEQDDLKVIRDTAMLMLMGCEGLRTIEICRLSEEDINWGLQTILIKGKGHNDLIYPREDTMAILKEYIDKKPKNTKNEEIVTPLFVNLSRYKKYHRITRDGVRRAINSIMSNAGLKMPGKSCHTLRHTCGTLVYEKTKDLQAVKEILRHRDPKVTSIYAHVMRRQTDRYTKTIPIKPLNKTVSYVDWNRAAPS